MAFFNTSNIKNMLQLKKAFKNLSKKYHPDNKETGDKDIFIEIKNEYDALKNEYVNTKNITISVEQAYKGCIIEYHGYKLVVPEHYYGSKPIRIGDENIIIKINNNHNEQIIFNGKGDIIVYKTVDINIFDVILGYKEIDILGNNIKISTKYCNKWICLKNYGYPTKSNHNKRENLYIKMILKQNILLSDDDKKIIEDMRKQYE